ncbi:hypothetical protein G6L37_02130 [Agrobacterium rubi]|nr:hypothetical protein [Agrobacterium rubi]NTF24192.1 hypothetical protein [Agrobacterium rubi]
MTLRKIVNDIRLHAAIILNASGITPVVELGKENAVSDVIYFQTKRGLRHVVCISVPKDCGENAWDRAAIAPISVKSEPVEGTNWELKTADGVRMDDIVGFDKSLTDAERVALVINNLDTYGAAFLPYDDAENFVCTDSRIARVVERMRHVTEAAGCDFHPAIADSNMSTVNTRIDWVELDLDDASFIVHLKEDEIDVSLDGVDMREFTVGTMAEFDEVMDELIDHVTELRASGLR